jgi:2,4-dienoyl-CoA reductase-like NADH-dependent reductase (Old Yellow Enzyme family)
MEYMMKRTGHDILFDPLQVGPMRLRNRIVMSPMTRAFSPGGIPGEDVASYYRRRAEAGVGLIVTEGTWVPHPGAANEENVPNFYGDEALAGWKQVVDEVHCAGGCIMPQLWHVGLSLKRKIEGIFAEAATGPADRQVGPSGYGSATGERPRLIKEPMTQRDIDDVIEAFATAAESAMRLGFDGVAFHGAHGYLFDQFFWSETNRRTDKYGGSIERRTRFACEVLKECRRRVGIDFPFMFRMSQWKLQDYTARMCATPQELERLILPLVEAGVDIFDCSQRRFWETEFEGSDLNLAGWVKKISGKPTMTVGSVGLDIDLTSSLKGEGSRSVSINGVVERLQRGDFDLIGVGRALISDPQWPIKVRTGAVDEMKAFNSQDLMTLW